MTTILDYRPEVAAAIADGSLAGDIPHDARIVVARIRERVEALVAPLTRVESLADAQALAATGEVEYLHLMEEYDKAISGSSVLQFEVADGPGVGADLRLPNADDDERWQGALQSGEGYFDWLGRQLRNGQSDDERRQSNEIIKETLGPIGRFLLAKLALVTAFATAPPPSPATVSSLAQLADECMTEVEDVFLAHADYREDDAVEPVPYEEVRANLGL